MGYATRTLSYTDAPLLFLQPGGEKPARYTYTPPAGQAAWTGQNDTHVVRVWNARLLDPAPSLDVEGFALGEHPTEVHDFLDEDVVKAVYYPETAALVRAVTGAAKVLVFDHNVRSSRLVKAGQPGIREPAKRVHNDYTELSGPQRLRDLVDPAHAERLLANRFAIVNVWRPIAEPVLESPLALCDARTVEARDFVPTDLIYRDRKGEIYSFAHNPKQRWFYFPEMRRDEALFIKCFDSATDGRARFSAHTAFDDPLSPPDAPARESIEIRTLAFFPEGQRRAA